MKELRKDLVLSDEFYQSQFKSTRPSKEPLGSYNPMQFAIRLRKDVHLEVDSINPGIHPGGTMSDKQVQAFSTYLHETIHWWQHVGSNYGLISSLKFPSQTHIVHNDLNEVLKQLGPFKSIRKYDFLNQYNSNDHINRVLNYFYDLEIGSWIAFDQTLAQKYSKHTYFDSVGHSYHMLWSAGLRAIASIVDPHFQFLPKGENWHVEFRRLRNAKVEGFYFGSPIMIIPIGVRAIYEGQARFCQLQYLYFASGKKYSMTDFCNSGMLNGVYGEAINYFLKLLDEKMPSTVDNPLIGLFLLVCDLAINPVEGFPLDIYYFETFIMSTDPGYRFHFLCTMIKEKYPSVKSAVINYSVSEYVELSRLLCDSIACFAPIDATAMVMSWIETQPSVQQLLSEESVWKFKDGNLPVRMFFSKYLRFQEDKLNNPEFFCWPGVHFSSHIAHELGMEKAKYLFDKHSALFMYKADGAVYPVLFDGIDERSIQDTFNSFFSWNCGYSMVRKWISEDGPFSFDYDWVTSTHTKEETKSWISENFRMTYGYHPDDYKFL